MAKELYLYNPIYSFVAEEVMREIDANMDNEVVLRLNTPGGSVFSGWGMVSKIKEHGNVTIKVDGIAASMGAFMLLFSNRVECADVSRFMLHRADMYAESDEQKAFLASVNKDLRAKMEQKINAEKFAEVTGVTIKEMFDSESRKDVWIDAKQAKKIGLVDKINKLDAKDVKAFSSAMLNVAAIINQPEVNSNTNQNPNKMNIEKLKAEHPEVFNQVLALGVKNEKDRVEAWLTYVDVDAKTVKEGIEGNDSPSLKVQAELNRKAFSMETLDNLEKGNPNEAQASTPKEGDGKKPTEVESFEQEIDKLLK